jgi:chorismate mutase
MTGGPTSDLPPEAIPGPPGGLAATESDRSVPVLDQLVEIRRSIDNIDAALVYLLAERFRCTQRVGRLKAEHGLPPADLEREAEQIARLRSLAESARLDPAFAEKFLAFVIEEVIRHHRAIAGGDRVGQAPEAAPERRGPGAVGGPASGPDMGK